jgi:drug/metabolite transporter (DMT)-like permease
MIRVATYGPRCYGEAVTTRQLAALLVLGVVWGASFLFLRVLVTAGMEPLGVSAARTLLGILSLVPVAYLYRSQFPRARRTWLAMAVLALTNFALPWTLFGIGQRHVPSGVGSITNSAQPLFAAIFATMVIRADSLGRLRVAGLLLGFGGVVVLMGSGLRHLGPESLKGIPIMVLATLCYGGSSVSIRRWLQHVAPIPLTFVQIGFATVYLAPLALFTGAYGHVAMGWHEWASLVLLGVVGSGFAVVIFMWLIQQVGPVRAAVVTYLMPPIGIFLGWLLLDEQIGWTMVAGLTLIITGVAMVQGVPLAALGRFLRQPLARRLRARAATES